MARRAAGLHGRPSRAQAPPRRSAAARGLHWVLAALGIGALATGYVISDVGWNGVGLVSRDWCVEAHKSMGLLMPPVCLAWAALALSRGFAKRSVAGRAVWLMHAALALGFLATALLGWAGSSAGRYGQAVFGLISAPEIVPTRDPKLAVRLYDLHKELAWWAMLALGLHVAGALTHLLILRDGVFTAMIRRPERRGPA
ncbi:MAG: cytochrome b/b6 domain-containing protein [Pseudomonadota bacterium]